MNIAKFRQAEQDIPLPIKSDLMHPDIYYYYRYLHETMMQHNLIDQTSVCVYSWIWADISSVDALFWKREIIWFDAAWLHNSFPFSDKRTVNTQIAWYDAEKMNILLWEICCMNNAEAISFMTTQRYARPWVKRNRWWYPTLWLDHSANWYQLIYELLCLGVPVDTLQVYESSLGWVLSLTISTSNNCYPKITIYQIDVLDNTYSQKIVEILDGQKSVYYLEKSGERIVGNICIPLQKLMGEEKTKILALGDDWLCHNRPLQEFLDLTQKNEWIDLEDTTMNWRICDIKHELRWVFDDNPKNKKELSELYWRGMFVYHRSSKTNHP